MSEVNYDGCGFCAHQTIEHFGGGPLPAWRSPDGSPVALSIGFAAYPGGLSQEKWKDAVLQATAIIEAACAVRFRFVEDGNQANIKIVAMPFNESDGPAGVLADCQLAQVGYRTDRNQVLMRIDPNERWTVAKNPPGNMIDAARVLAHEITHGLGVSHINPKNLMQAFYDVNIREMRAGDTAELQARYPGEGKAPGETPVAPSVPVPVTPSTPAPKSGDTEIFALGKRGDRYFVRFYGFERLI